MTNGIMAKDYLLPSTFFGGVLDARSGLNLSGKM
jgi:hypothetical protein